MVTPTLLHLLDEPYWWLLLVCELLLIGSGATSVNYGFALLGYTFLFIGALLYSAANFLLWLSPSARNSLIRDGAEITQWHFASLMFHSFVSAMACLGIVATYIGMHQ